MQRQIKGIGIKYYYQKLSNGLEIFVIPTSFATKMASFTTKYGSDHLEFKKKGEANFVKTPSGIAHFLEHKLFEYDKESVFDFFHKNGAYCNALTDNERTTYYFSGPDNFNKNLNFLLNYVQTPYLTNENVEKEKGIILQELKMRQDDNFIFLYETFATSLFQVHPRGISVGGEMADVERTTKEDLMQCYETFYHPSNMFVVVCGDIDPKKVIDVIQQNQQTKEFPSSPKIELKKYDEPDEVAKKEIIINRDIKTPKVTFNYKINITNNIADRVLLDVILDLFTDCVFDKHGELNEKVSDLTENDLRVSQLLVEKHWVLSIWAETHHAVKVIKIIKEYLQDFQVDVQTFNRKKKNALSYFLKLGDSTSGLNNFFTSFLAEHGHIDEDYYLKFKNLTYEDFMKETKKLKFDNYSKVIMQKDLQKK